MFTKYQRTEDSEVLSKEKHAQIERELHRLGKTKVQDLDDDQVEKVTRGLQK